MCRSYPCSLAHSHDLCSNQIRILLCDSSSKIYFTLPQHHHDRPCIPHSPAVTAVTLRQYPACFLTHITALRTVATRTNYSAKPSAPHSTPDHPAHLPTQTTIYTTPAFSFTIVSSSCVLYSSITTRTQVPDARNQVSKR